MELVVIDGRVCVVELYRATETADWFMHPPRPATLPEIVSAAEAAGEDVGPMLARLEVQDVAWRDDRTADGSARLAALNLPRKGNVR